MRKTPIPQILVGLGVALILITGIIHFIDAPDNLSESTLKGGLFIVNGLAAFAAAYGIYRNAGWGWLLGLLVAGGAFIMYIVSRTVGFPGLGVDDDWLEPMGILSLLVEGSFVVLALVALLRYRLTAPEPAAPVTPQPHNA
ncbi:MAG: hypothetical protein JNL34_17270 [Anaerolineae bacterium]|nr:hypothetical protein [Anaerolineae bacterium]